MTDPTTALIVATPAELLAPAVEAAKRFVGASKAENTMRAYRADFDAWAAWCAGRALPSLPASPELVATYLAGLAEAGRKASTIERALAGIVFAHRAAGHDWPKGHRAVTAVVSGIRRTKGTKPSQKAPITDRELAAIVATLDGTLGGLRDRALVLLGWFGAFRRSELVALDVSDVAFPEEGAIVTVRRSKTDQDGRGYEKGIPFAGDPDLCAVRALRAYLEAASITEGAIFRAVTKHGLLGERLADRAVARIVKGAAEAAGLDAERFAGHSLRSGFATTAAKRGKGLDAIMRTTGHKSHAVAMRYVRHASLFTDNAAAGLV